MRWSELTDEQKERYRQITHRCRCLRPPLDPEMSAEFLATVAGESALKLYEKMLERLDEQHARILEAES